MTRKMLLAASTGGHLAQLDRLAPMLGASPDSLWVTFRTPQSESLLAGKRVLWVPYIKPRDWRGVLNAERRITAALRTEHFEAAVSTGAGLALAALPAARRRGIPTKYIESVSRVNGPSLTGRLLEWGRTAELHTQHPSWANARWKPHPSVLHTYRPVPRSVVPGAPRLFVTLGTIEGYRFDSVVDAVLSSGLADESTVWQLGATPRDDLPGLVQAQMPAEEFSNHVASADVVVSHAGVGTLLQLLDAGVHPVLAIRRKSRREHVDDHQAQIASLADALGIATVREGPDVDRNSLLRAAGLATRTEMTLSGGRHLPSANRGNQ